jgi:hypothetical protein
MDRANPDQAITTAPGRSARRARRWGVVGGVLGSLFGIGSALIAVYVHGAQWAEAPYPAFFSRRHVLAYDVFLLFGLAVGAGFLVAALLLCRFGRYPRTDAFGALLYRHDSLGPEHGHFVDPAGRHYPRAPSVVLDPSALLDEPLLARPAAGAPPVQGQAPRVLTGIVVKVVDGDTTHVRIGNRIEKVRYIGMNAPELHHPTKSVEPLAHEAMETNRKLVEGQTVRLELDVQERDPRRSGTRLGTRPPTSGGARRHEDDLFHQPTRTH